MLVDWIAFSQDLANDDISILRSRIDRLCALLANSARPSSMLLPVALGYLQDSETKFWLTYRLPEHADPNREVTSLYSILQPNRRSIAGTKTRPILPTLEEKYCLAITLAEGLLSLINVKWVHESLDSSNIMFFHEKGSARPIDFAKPLMIGFGVARPVEPGEKTIDTRSLDSPLSLWQHPQLRRGPHHRYEPRHDIYSLGMILCEIGFWQDLNYFGKENETAFDFHQRVVNACYTKLAHFVGETYRDVVLACINDYDLWTKNERGEGAPSLHESFCWDILRPLRSCQPKS